jgi:hypothetical protein
MRSSKTLAPRNGHTLVSGIVARISGCQNQKEMSLEDQEDHGREVVGGLYDGPAEYRVIATTGKGERLDRPELAEIEALVRTKELDLLVMEDVGRLVRGVQAVVLWGIAVDHGVRCIAPNDGCDTADEGWEEDLMSACRDHVNHNAHTSKRLKQKLMNRFKKFGGATPLPVAGYVKPEGAKTFAEWLREEEATPKILAGLETLERTLNCEAAAETLNALGFPPGPYCRSPGWDGPMVRRYFKNPILKGMPERGNRHTVKHHETGRRVSVRNPQGGVAVEYPHLAHVDADRLDRMNALLKDRNGSLGRKPVNGSDPKAGVPRKRTVFPGQHATCWYCGRQMVWGGNGVTENLMCSGAREWRCWNSVGFDGPDAVAAVTGEIMSGLGRLDGFDGQWRELVEAAARERGAGPAEALARLARDEEALAREKRNVADAVAKCGAFGLLAEKLKELEDRERDLARERRSLERQRSDRPRLPGSAGALRGLLEAEFSRLSRTSQEFGDLMRLLVPEFHVYLVRLCDGGHPLPRAKVELALAGDVADAARVPGLAELLTRGVTLDLFEPPQRERVRAEAAALAAAGVKQREIAGRLSEPATQAAVQKALCLDRRMKKAGLSSPYVLLEEPPGDYPKLRRHKNPKYRFEPLEGYVRPDL